MVQMTATEWLDAYRAAWETKDPDAAVAIFTEDARYRKHPYEEPFRGRDGIRAYWTEVTSTQEDVRLRYGRVLTDDRHAAVEWWVTMRNAGADVTIAGEFFLVFDDDGLCAELREYWHVGEGRLDPPAGWGG